MELQDQQEAITKQQIINQQVQHVVNNTYISEAQARATVGRAEPAIQPSAPAQPPPPPPHQPPHQQPSAPVAPPTSGIPGAGAGGLKGGAAGKLPSRGTGVQVPFNGGGQPPPPAPPAPPVATPVNYGVSAPAYNASPFGINDVKIPTQIGRAHV